MNKLMEKLLSKTPIVTDGAWGTELQQRGLLAGECPDGWNLTHPELVEQVASAYVEAGSRIILTNTFGANRITLARHHLAERAQEINRIGAEISRKAAGSRAFVFASVGPTGKFLLMGDIEEDEMRSVFTEQIEALAKGGAHGVVVETMSDLDETAIAVSVAHELGLTVVASMVFDSGKDNDRTMMGATPEQVCERLAEAGADVIGANCGQGIEKYVPICSRLHQATNLPIWIKANAGLPQLVDGKTVFRSSVDSFVSYVPELVKAGASFIGGCCGTSPEFISATVKALGG
jgi:5-methyltetrahydrofolate--homocysteine methyltransferase